MGLIWNLFLAWIPYLLSYILKNYVIQQKTRWYFIPWIAIWLLFFPNAPYILTDMFHLTPKHNVPIWYDLVLIFSFAWSGLILGILSLEDMHFIVTAKTNKRLGWFFVMFTSVLGSFGIYLGRYLRWNSWDIVSNPYLLLSDITEIVLNPILHKKAVGVTMLFSVFLLLIYFSFRQMKNNNPITKNENNAIL
jgi:uncharacterized membrane protein